MGYRCLIVDDEPLALNILESYISIVPELSLAGKCLNAFEAMKTLQSEKVDIMFLDIDMPQLTGTNFLKSLLKPPKVIFTTAYKEFAHDAFELDAVDYLLKPISLERFIKAINKIGKKAEISYSNIEEADSPQYQPFLYFKVERQMIKVLLNQILYIESLKDYVKIVCENQSPIVSKQTISALEEMLPRKKFLRIHRSFIIASEKVSSYTRESVLISGQSVPVGRVYQHQLQQLVKTI
jgi:two-component system, LytTR family, response regulator